MRQQYKVAEFLNWLLGLWWLFPVLAMLAALAFFFNEPIDRWWYNISNALPDFY